MNANDKLNLADVMAAADAVGRAEEALAKAMAGRVQGEREQFVFEIGFALERLMRVFERIRAGEDEPPSFVCPRCGALSFNPNDIANRYCGRCHVFVEEPDAP